MKLQISIPNLELWRIANQFENQAHTHPNLIQITIPERGTCHFSLERKSLPLHTGLALVQHPGEEHSFHLEKGSGVYIIQIDKSLLSVDGHPQEIEFESQQQILIEEFSHRMKQWSESLLFQEVDALKEEEIQLQVVSFLYQKLKGNHQKRRLQEMKPMLPLADTQMMDVLDYIHEHYKEQLTMDSLSAIALQSKYHFIRSFDASVGVTPYQYILQLRIREAKSRLASTTHTITHISYSLGFSTPSQFFRVFAKAVGMTPESYRKALQ